MSWSTSELRVRLAPLNRFKPSSKIFYWPFQGGTSFVDLLCFCSVLCLICFVRVCLYVLCGHLLEKGWPLGSRLWCLLWVCHFPIGILGQVWYLIVSIPDLCNLITLLMEQARIEHAPNGSLLTYITSADALVNNAFLDWVMNAFSLHTEPPPRISVEISKCRKQQYKAKYCTQNVLFLIYGPRREKICPLDFKQSEIQTSLLSYRD